MHIEEFRDYCLSKKGVTESFPFDEQTLVFKVMGKVFALAGLDEPDYYVNLKCDPEKAIELREKYTGVKPGYHMSKKHCNTVYNDGSVTDELYYQWIDDSYELARNIPQSSN